MSCCREWDTIVRGLGFGDEIGAFAIKELCNRKLGTS
jgi:hypothetical protein